MIIVFLCFHLYYLFITYLLHLNTYIVQNLIRLKQYQLILASREDILKNVNIEHLIHKKKHSERLYRYVISINICFIETNELFRHSSIRWYGKALLHL